MKLPRPTAVIFDWDNTLVDTWPVIGAAINATFREWKMPEWSMEQVQTRVKKSMRDSFPELFGDDWQRAGEFYQAQYRANHFTNLHPLPGAERVLEAVRAHKLFSAVVSNKKGPVLRQEIEHLGWTKFFDTIVGSDDAKRDKPHADPVHLAFEKSHLKPGRDVWFVGDSDVDLQCAHATGCTAILFGKPTQKDQHTSTHYCGFPYDAQALTHEDTLKFLSSI